MSKQGAPILVVGGGSRIAGALVPLLGDAAAYAVRRSAGRPQEIIVDDYDTVPDAVLTDADCVINCVGTSTGGAEHLNRINCEIPRRLAAAAREAGVRHFVHISSFSVYGGAHAIDRTTDPAPASDYGRSKLAGDKALLALADDRFTVTILRLPLIYAEDVAGKLAQLLRLWARARVLPVPAGDVRRAMIGIDLSAEVIARLADEPVNASRITFAADPLPFTYADAARARSDAKTLRHFTVPRGLARLAERVVPSVGGRLFADSKLADDDNLAIRYGLTSRLYRDIAAADLY
ncbi:MAG: NAD-dependent epimerase/dehydratase family protein [Erythrobacter sp.]|nr:NAD-dependent epimerase/dehydratase family protein [Erythrobacter sp.]